MIAIKLPIVNYVIFFTKGDIKLSTQPHTIVKGRNKEKRRRKMKKILNRISIVVLMMTCFISSMTFAENDWVEHTYDLNDFDEIIAEEAFVVNVIQGEEFSVKVSVTKDIIDKLDIRVEDKTLILGVKSNQSIINADYIANITMPDLKLLKARNAASINGEMTLTDLSIEATCAATVVITGSADFVEVESLQASTVDLEEFVVRNADVICKNASVVSLYATESITAMSRLASDVKIRGDAEVTASSDFTSDIHVGGDVLADEDEIVTGEMFVNDYQVTATSDCLNNFWTKSMLEWDDHVDISVDKFEQSMDELEEILDGFQDNLLDWIDTHY